MPPAMPRQGGDAADLGRQIREQIREQVEAARQQALAARSAQGGTMIGVPVPPPIEPAIPPQAVDIVIAFFVMIAVIAIGKPIARAYARRVERKPVPLLDSGVAEQLQRIEQTVDSMAIEVERISEAQRYMAKLQTERMAGLPKSD
ncbi:MAG TPA: hypothetical protein VF041_13005 [Gemmatimonadaceae bacterium]